MANPNAPKKGDNPSGITNKQYASKVLGGYPPQRSAEESNNLNSPSKRGKPPGAFRP